MFCSCLQFLRQLVLRNDFLRLPSKERKCVRMPFGKGLESVLGVKGQQHLKVLKLTGKRFDSDKWRREVSVKGKQFFLATDTWTHFQYDAPYRSVARLRQWCKRMSSSVKKQNATVEEVAVTMMSHWILFPWRTLMVLGGFAAYDSTNCPRGDTANSVSSKSVFMFVLRGYSSASLPMEVKNGHSGWLFYLCAPFLLCLLHSPELSPVMVCGEEVVKVMR